MTKFIKNSKTFGFGIAGVIIVIAAVAVLGGGVYFLFVRMSCELISSDVVVCSSYGGRLIQKFYKQPVQSPTTPIGSAGTPSLNENTKDWKTYRNEKYGFEVRYPPLSQISEEGPDTYELRLRAGQQISGTQAPLLETIVFKDTQNILLTIDIPNHKAFEVVSDDYNWWRRPCGQEGFATIRSEAEITFAGHKTLRLTSVSEDPAQATPVHYYCINFPLPPIIIYYDEKAKNIAEGILSTFKFIK